MRLKVLAGHLTMNPVPHLPFTPVGLHRARLFRC